MLRESKSGLEQTPYILLFRVELHIMLCVLHRHMCPLQVKKHYSTLVSCANMFVVFLLRRTPLLPLQMWIVFVWNCERKHQAMRFAIDCFMYGI